MEFRNQTYFEAVSCLLARLRKVSIRMSEVER